MYGNAELHYIQASHASVWTELNLVQLNDPAMKVLKGNSRQVAAHADIAAECFETDAALACAIAQRHASPAVMFCPGRCSQHTFAGQTLRCAQGDIRFSLVVILSNAKDLTDSADPTCHRADTRPRL